ncbi:MAG TPA: lipoate--protein ligase family protein [Verrucomicrobiae bacterium]|jgi:lipoate-protein ligase A|nr:lipoate--protein ligase family protein [Verrucomicrobiae bacterium]
MKHLDLSLPSPAENLACDEALLDWREENDGEEILRFWESPKTFVVVGYANKIATEVNIENCRAKQTPIFRRCSGGGTVLQGAGCLNYALILRITEDGPCRTITSANEFIMEKNRAAIETLLKSKIFVRGHTDLALDGLKSSGNSQRRKKNFLLFHGTFLLNFNLALVAAFLKMPSKQPDYRASRSHGEFLTNLNLLADTVKTALKQSWNAIEELKGFPKQEIQKLAMQKYSTDEWNFKL